MKNKLLAFLALGLLAGPMAASAVPVTWEFTGTYDSTSRSPNVSIGDSFHGLVTFDPGASLVGTQQGGVFNPGTRYEYDTSGLSFVVSLPGFPNQLFTSLGGGSDYLYLHDNSGAYVTYGEPAVVDGLTLWVSDGNVRSLSLVLRGSILDIFNGPGLPTDPDPRLLNLELATFQWSFYGEEISPGTYTAGEFGHGRISSLTRVTVPEPGTLALLGLGLVGLGFARRRKHA